MYIWLLHFIFLIEKFLLLLFFSKEYLFFFQKKKTHELSKAKHLRFKVYNFQFVKLNIHVKK